MKRIRLLRLLCLALCCVVSLVMLVACVPQKNPPGGTHDPNTPPGNTDEHHCVERCPNCNGCLNKDCNDPVCQPKCDCDNQNDDDNKDDLPYVDLDNHVMPVVRINTADESNDFITVPNRDSKLNDEIEYVDATVTVEDGDDVVINQLEASVKARGNYTLNYEKKPIRIKFNKKQSVLGLNNGAKFKNWVLLADWKDLSMSNNAIAFYLGNAILGSDGYYCSDYRNVEVYINGEYWGVYLLVEQQEAKGADGRTSATAVPDDYIGTDIGYLVEYDGYYTDERNMPNDAGDPTFELSYNNYAPLTKLNGASYNTEWAQRGYTVKSDIYDNAQLYFVQSFMDNAYRIAYEAVYNNDYYSFNHDYSDVVSATGTTKDVVSAVIDVQSLVDTYILSEIACDPDIAWSSFYISLDMTENGSHKLIFEAPWDFDSAFGIKQGFVNNAYGMYAGNCDNPWLILLIREQWFMDMVREKWAELVEQGVTTAALELVNTYKTDFESSYYNNYVRWSNRIKYGNSELVWELNTYTTQAEASNYLYNWLNKRFQYLDAVWGDGYNYGDIPSKPEEGSTAYRFEAEDCYFDYPITIDDWHSELASGGLFLGKISDSYGARITLTVYVEQDCTAFLSVGLSKRSFEAIFSEWFDVSVNNTLLDVPPRIIPACDNDETEWVAWTDVGLMPVELKAGYNTITFTTTGGKATNIDYFELWSTTPISQW